MVFRRPSVLLVPLALLGSCSKDEPNSALRAVEPGYVQIMSKDTEGRDKSLLPQVASDAAVVGDDLV